MQSSIPAGSIEPVVVDITDESAIAASGETIAGHLGGEGLGGLVNNAGIAVGGPLEFTRLEDLRRQFEVNLFGHVAVTQRMLPLLRKGRGRIVLISSDNGRWAPPYTGPYAASKFALEAIGDVLRFELHRSGISVSIVEPGQIRTPLFEKGLGEIEELERHLPEQSQPLYGDVPRALRGALEQGKKNGIPPEQVAKAIGHALTARRPKTRYRVGRDAQAMVALRAVLPDRAFDYLLRRMVRRLESR